MFKNTSKHLQQSQQYINSLSLANLRQHTTLACPSLYDQTHCKSLPDCSVKLLSYVIDSLVGESVQVDRDRRGVYTVAKWDYENQNVSVRCVFVQPELVSATAQFPIGSLEHMQNSADSTSFEYPNAGRCSIRTFTNVIQITGRQCPYVVDRSGKSDSAEWTFFNIKRSSFVFIIADEDGVGYYMMTKRSLEILSQFCPPTGAFVFTSSMGCYKITSEPSVMDESANANKNTCVIIYCDGSFGIQGTPRKSKGPCWHVRQSILNVSTSRSWNSFLASLSKTKQE